MNRTGTNPIDDIRSFWSLWKLMIRIKPQAVLGYTVKPVIYGLLAAQLAGVPRRYALITGLGYSFQGEGKRWRTQALVQQLYTLALSKVNMIFSNRDDAALFKQRGICAMMRQPVLSMARVWIRQNSVWWIYPKVRQVFC